MLAMAYLLLTL